MKSKSLVIDGQSYNCEFVFGSFLHTDVTLWELAMFEVVTLNCTEEDVEGRVSAGIKS